MKPKIPPKELTDFIRQNISYCRLTGLLTWKTASPKGLPAGRSCGNLNKFGYLRFKVSVNGVPYTVIAHRVAWLLHYGEWPELEIDHINSNRIDNRIENLRQATRSQNMCNTRRANKEGLKGVKLKKDCNRWEAQIRVRGKHYYLGLHSTAEAAHEAYCEAAKRLHGEYSSTK
ncbi:HNH endonuclease [Pantoea agglomerans]|uniref:HNH endonuclease n=1 Tax=Enterobacter agglomerans TaxID=549 RepID=UPI003AF25E08